MQSKKIIKKKLQDILSKYSVVGNGWKENPNIQDVLEYTKDFINYCVWNFEGKSEYSNDPDAPIKSSVSLDPGTLLKIESDYNQVIIDIIEHEHRDSLVYINSALDEKTITLRNLKRTDYFIKKDIYQMSLDHVKGVYRLLDILNYLYVFRYKPSFVFKHTKRIISDLLLDVSSWKKKFETWYNFRLFKKTPGLDVLDDFLLDIHKK